MYATYQKYTLHFKFLAGTSRGVLRHKDSYFLKVSQEKGEQLYGIGECAPLAGLSIDDVPDYEKVLADLCKKIAQSPVPANESDIAQWVEKYVDAHFPSLRFGVEVALLDLLNGGQKNILTNSWSSSPFSPIPINGLIWMNDRKHMMNQLQEKLEAGFDCIKIKIGAIDFDEEMALLEYIRKHFSFSEISIRVDANGAFDEKDVFAKLERLASFDVHSIEQPIQPNQARLMRTLCAQSRVPIALDEELIGVHGLSLRSELLDQLMPQYIILKPTLLGGIHACREWIRLAEERNIGWWITSALESNIGLNAISQFTATYPVALPQGLGTGQLYENNIPSPLTIREGMLHYNPDFSWQDQSVIS
jgi:o-succinylbenzoate synthase